MLDECFGRHCLISLPPFPLHCARRTFLPVTPRYGMVPHIYEFFTFLQHRIFTFSNFYPSVIWLGGAWYWLVPQIFAKFMKTCIFYFHNNKTNALRSVCLLSLTRDLLRWWRRWRRRTRYAGLLLFRIFRPAPLFFLWYKPFSPCPMVGILTDLDFSECHNMTGDDPKLNDLILQFDSEWLKLFPCQLKNWTELNLPELFVIKRVKGLLPGWFVGTPNSPDNKTLRIRVGRSLSTTIIKIVCEVK